MIARIAGCVFEPGGLVAGVIVAWGAIGLGVAFLSPVALGATAVIGTAAGAAVVVRSVDGIARERRAAIGAIVAVAVLAINAVERHARARRGGLQTTDESAWWAIPDSN